MTLPRHPSTTSPPPTDTAHVRDASPSSARSTVEAPPARPERPALQPLRLARDFQRVMRHGRRARRPLLSIATHPGELDTVRVGFAISRRVGGAVVRNRARRRLRAILRALPLAPATDVVITVQPAAATASFEALRRDLEACAHDASIVAPVP